MRNSSKPLTAVQKKQGQIIASAAPAEFFARHGISPDFKTVGDLEEAVAVLACYFHGSEGSMLDLVEARIKRQAEVDAK